LLAIFLFIYVVYLPLLPRSSESTRERAKDCSKTRTVVLRFIINVYRLHTRTHETYYTRIRFYVPLARVYLFVYKMIIYVRPGYRLNRKNGIFRYVRVTVRYVTTSDDATGLKTIVVVVVEGWTTKKKINK